MSQIQSDFPAIIPFHIASSFDLYVSLGFFLVENVPIYVILANSLWKYSSKKKAAPNEKQDEETAEDGGLINISSFHRKIKGRIVKHIPPNTPSVCHIA